MAAYMYFVLYEQITSLKASQTGCARDFRYQVTPFKRLVTGKRQPGRPSRLTEMRGGSSCTLEEVAEMEGATPAKQRKKTPKATPAAKPEALSKSGKGRGKGSRGKGK